jgi:predicted DNA-binding transcriptional regulator AlpA
MRHITPLPDLSGLVLGGSMNARQMAKESKDSSLFHNRIDFWKIEDVANYTGYSKRTLYNLTSRDLIPHRKKRGKLYFVPFEIQNWIEEGDLE